MKLSEKVQRVIAVEKISPAELQIMVERAAITSTRDCNLRYFQWVFRMEGDVLQDMQYTDLITIGKNTSPNRMMEEHDDCDGEGCRKCGWVGQISRAVRDHTATALRT